MIFVLENGGIVEQGTYDYLYAIGGRFTEMVDQQALGNGLKTDDAVPTLTVGIAK